MPKALITGKSNTAKNVSLLSSATFSGTLSGTSQSGSADEPIDALAPIRSKIVARLGEGGMKAIGRSFRIMDNDGNKKLNPEELFTGFADCDIELTGDELDLIFDRLDTNGDGSVDMNEFLRLIRGGLPRCRQAIVDKAWLTLDKTGDGKVTIDDVVGRYQVANHPAVVKGEKTGEEVLNDFISVFEGPMGNKDGTVTKEEFLDYYAGVSACIDDHAYFDLVVRNAWRIDQPNNFGKTEEDFRTMKVNNFQSSAYWGARGELPPPDAPDKVGARRDPRFASMISNKLEPFPMTKPGILPKGVGAASYLGVGGHPQFHKTLPTKDSAIVVVPQEGSQFNSSVVGKLPNVSKSRGFLVDGTTTQHMHGEFGDDVMDTYTRNKEREMEVERERKELQTTPFSTSDPTQWRTSSSDYANFARVDRSAFQKGNALPKLAHGEANRARTQQAMAAAQQTNLDELRQRIIDKNLANLPRGYQTKPSGVESTYKDHFAGYDPSQAQDMNDRWARQPLQHRNRVATEGERQMFKEVEQRHANRHNGMFATEKADFHTDLFDKTEVSHTFDRKGAFGLKNGVRLLNDKVHKPRDVRTGDEYSASQVVPGHFKPMSSSIQHRKD